MPSLSTCRRLPPGVKQQVPDPIERSALPRLRERGRVIRAPDLASPGGAAEPHCRPNVLQRHCLPAASAPWCAKHTLLFRSPFRPCTYDGVLDSSRIRCCTGQRFRPLRVGTGTRYPNLPLAWLGQVGEGATCTHSHSPSASVKVQTQIAVTRSVARGKGHRVKSGRKPVARSREFRRVRGHGRKLAASDGLDSGRARVSARP